MAGRLITPDQLAPALSTWAADVHGGEVADVDWLGGHAGLSFRFDLVAGGERTPLVIRLAAPGVAQKGSNDVLRQVPLLERMHAAGVPVAPVHWSGPLLGTAAVMQARVDGGPLDLRGEHPRPEGDPLALAAEAIRALRDVHAIDMEGWTPPADAEAVIARWEAIHGKAGQEAAAAPVAAKLRREAARHAPRIGVTHGDFHTGNMLFADGHLRALIDWELAGIGPQVMDLGWLAMFSEPSIWAPPFDTILAVRLPRTLIVESYAGGPADGDDIDFGEALACFAFSSIIAFNVGLHRTGKREDPVWEEFADSHGALLERAASLV